MSKSRYFTHVGTVLESMLVRGIGDAAGPVSEVSRSWNEIVGNQIAKNTSPFAMKNSILLVHVSNSVWLHHLMFLKKELLFRLKHVFGRDRISDIKFRIGHL